MDETRDQVKRNKPDSEIQHYSEIAYFLSSAESRLINSKTSGDEGAGT